MFSALGRVLTLSALLAFSGTATTPALAANPASPAYGSGGPSFETGVASVLPVASRIGVNRQCPPFCPPIYKRPSMLIQKHKPIYPQVRPYNNGVQEIRHKRRKHGSIHLRFYPGYYYRSPFFYDPFFYDPYYYGRYPYAYPRYSYPRHYSRGISCGYAGGLLRRQGYRSVDSYDCSGKKYGFHARKGKKRYNCSVSAWNGNVSCKRR